MAFSNNVRKGRLLVYDSLAVPGQSLSLIADLIEEGIVIQGPLGGEVLRFQVAGRSLGTALTGGDGRAVKAFVPRTPGVLDLVVRAENHRRVEASEARAQIFVWDRKSSLIIVCQAALLDSSGKPALGLRIPDIGDPPPPALNGKMVKALSALSGRAHLVYVSSRDRKELPDLRRWMGQSGIPAGPLFLVKASPSALAQQVEIWQRDGRKNITGALAGTPDEAQSLLSKGLKTVVPPGASTTKKWPSKTIRTKDWTDVVTQLAS